MLLNREDARTFKSFCRDNAKGNLINVIKKLEDGIEKNPFPNVKLLIDTLEKIIKEDMTEEEFNTKYEMCLNLVQLICTVKEDNHFYETMYKQTIDKLNSNDKFFKENQNKDIYPVKNIVAGIYNLFKNKSIYIEMLERLCQIENSANVYYVIKYMQTHRWAYTDEAAFMSAVNSYIDAIKNTVDAFTINEKAKTREDLDFKNAGINPTTRSEIDAMWDKFEKIAGEFKIVCQDTLKIGDKVKAYENSVKKMYDSMVESINKASTGIITEKDNAIFDITKSRENTISEINRLLKTFNNSLENLKKTLLDDVGDQIKEVKKVLKDDVDSIGLKNKDIIKELIERIDELERKYENSLRDISSNMGSNISNRREENIPSIGMPAVIIRKEMKFEQHSVLPLFESDEKVEKKIRKLMSNLNPNEIYHPKFKTIARLVLFKDPIVPVMLVGPSGAGKSHSVQQLAEVTGLKLYNIGYINEEYKITGFQDANSNYYATAFYLAYKFGGLCHFDELDNSHPSAAMILNEVLGTSKKSSFLFPNGEEVQKHPYFRPIASVNTWGDGADSVHVTRAKLDGSTVDRFVQVKYDYDQAIEKMLAPEEEMHTFIRAFREACIETNIKMPITYRAFLDIFRFINEGGFTIEEALELRLARGNSQDKLNSIVGAMGKTEVRNNQYYKALQNVKSQVR